MSVFNPFCKSRKIMKGGGAGYTEPAKTLLDVELIVDDGASVYEAEKQVNLVSGQKYTVQTDSGTYESECIYATSDDEQYWIIGNPVFLGLSDTGETFGVMVGNEGDLWVVACADYNNGTHMTISIPETVHTIDPKYLPVIEITSAEYPTGEASGSSVALSEEESAQLNAFARAKIPAPIRLKVNLEMGLVEGCAYFDYINMGGISVYMGAMADVDMAFMDDGSGNWFMGD